MNYDKYGIYRGTDLESRVIRAIVREILKTPKGIYFPSEPEDIPSEPKYISIKQLSFLDYTKSGYEAFFVPELLLAKTKAEKGSVLRNYCYYTPSVIATGKSKGGDRMIVYAHVPTKFNSLKNMQRMAEKAAELKKVEGRASELLDEEMSQEEFDSLLSQEGNGRVFVVKDLIPQKYSLDSIREIFNSPLTRPFSGLNETQLKAYFENHLRIYGQDLGMSDFNSHRGYKLDNFHMCVPEKDDSDLPRARLAAVNGHSNYIGDDSLGGFESNAPIRCAHKFFCVKPLFKPEVGPEDILEVVRKYVPALNQSGLEKEVKELYNLE